MVATIDGEVAGIIGISREGDIGKYFSEFKPELRPHLKSITILRAIKASLQIVRDYHGPVVAVAQDGEGCRILHRLGFDHIHGANYVWANYSSKPATE
jgi:hypothetical protein